MNKVSEKKASAGRSATTRQIRGSSLLVVGRVISLLLNFGVQVLTVRYLSKLEYGAFANALYMVSMGGTLCVLGLNKAVSRFAPIQHEGRQFGQLFGTITFASSIIVALGLVLISAVHLFESRLGSIASSQQAVSILLVLIVLAPLEALDSLLKSLYAVFSNAWAIFVRRHILGPGLKLAAVLAVTLTSGDALALAFAYVGAGVLGLAIGLSLLLKILRDEELLPHFRLGSIEFQPRQLLGFSVPMMGSEMVLVLRGTAVVVLLGIFHDPATVAAFSAVYPLARMIRSVLESFTLMFMPAVARLQARGQLDQLSTMYWQSTAWVAMLSFPAFLVCFAVARPVTALVFGERYADSGIILAVLSVGYFVQACVGLAPRTLKAMGLVRTIMKIDAAAIVVALILDFSLIPQLGALGGAIAACATLSFHMLLNQVAVAGTNAVPLFHRPYLKMISLFLLSTAGLTLLQARFPQPVWIAVPIAALVTMLVFYLSRDLLQVTQTFPELRKVPLVGKTAYRLLETPALEADAT